MQALVVYIFLNLVIMHHDLVILNCILLIPICLAILQRGKLYVILTTVVEIITISVSNLQHAFNFSYTISERWLQTEELVILCVVMIFLTVLTCIFCDALKKDEIFLDTFIKKRINANIGARKTEKTVDVIRNSRIICIYGMSIGITDKIWWEELIKWLISNSNNKLVIFCKEKEEKIKSRIPAPTIRMTEKVRRKIFENGRGNRTETEYKQIKDRIMVVFNSRIFSFRNIDDDNDSI